MKLSDLFVVKKGHGLDLTNIDRAPWGTGIVYVSCADKTNGVTGWVQPIPGKIPAAPGTISVALTGNSVLSAFVQAEPYYTASHMAILTPKQPDMSFAEKLWWAQCIRANRYRFGFGRKADRTIGGLLIPDRAPDWVTDEVARDAMIELAKSIPEFTPQPIPKSKIHVKTVTGLFSVTRGHKLDLVTLTQVEPLQGVAYVSRGEKNNGVIAWVKQVEGIEPAAPGTISVALGGNVMAAFVQPTPYYTAQNVDVLTPLDPAMTLAEKLWWASCILANRYRYNYGRHANRTFRSLSLPSSVPDWVQNIPHEAVEDLRSSVEDVADSIGEDQFKNFENLALKLFNH